MRQYVTPIICHLIQKKDISIKQQCLFSWYQPSPHKSIPYITWHHFHTWLCSGKEHSEIDPQVCSWKIVYLKNLYLFTRSPDVEDKENKPRPDKHSSCIYFPACSFTLYSQKVIKDFSCNNRFVCRKRSRSTTSRGRHRRPSLTLVSGSSSTLTRCVTSYPSLTSFAVSSSLHWGVQGRT